MMNPIQIIGLVGLLIICIGGLICAYWDCKRKDRGRW